MLSDVMTVCGAEEESPQNQHIKGALEQLNVIVFLGHGRHSTITATVDGRHSTTENYFGDINNRRRLPGLHLPGILIR